MKSSKYFKKDFSEEIAVDVIDRSVENSEIVSEIEAERVELEKYQEKIQKMFNVPFSLEQTEAVVWEKGTLIINACAGSGKTTTLCANIIYKCKEYGVDPKNILSITFSNKASMDMAIRYGELVEEVDGRRSKLLRRRPNFKTFHAFFKQTLEHFLYNDTPLQVCGANNYYLLLSNQITDYTGKDKKEILDDILNYRSKMINSGMTRNGIEGVTINEKEAGFSLSNYIKVVNKYEELKERDGYIDFDDMQVKLLEAILQNNEVSRKIIDTFQSTYKYVYIDEYQDISPVQKQIMDILLGDSIDNLTVIGDDDQCQPLDTKITMIDGSVKLLKDVQIGDKVIGYDVRKDKAVTKSTVKNSQEIIGMSEHKIKGLIEVETNRGKCSKYSKFHWHLCKFKESIWESYGVFLILSKGGNYYIHLDEMRNMSMWIEEVEKLWILDVNENKQFLKEKQGRYMVDTRERLRNWGDRGIQEDEDNSNAISLESKNKIVSYFEKFFYLDNRYQIATLLEENNRSYRYPFYERGKNKLDGYRGIFKIRAINLIKMDNYLEVVEIDEAGNSVYVDVEKVSYYPEKEEVVKSLYVSGTRNYVGDGVLTHNCIYSFRGSKSEYIMQFKYDNYNTKELFLSTNYRCPKMILDKVKPSIEKNKIRIEKDMDGLDKDGYIEYFEETTGTYDKLVSKVKEIMQDYDEFDLFDNVAILVRLNSQKTILSDILITNRIPVDVGGMKSTLRNNRIYKLLNEIIEMIKTQDNELFAQHGRRIFSSVRTETIRSYLKRQDNWYDDFVRESTRTYQVDQNKIDIIERMLLTEDMGQLFDGAWQLIYDNLVYNAERGYGNLKGFTDIYNYLREIAEGYTREDFAELENKKEVLLRQYAESDRGIVINTIHSVKGLEYPVVFVPGLDDDVFPSSKRFNMYIEEGKFEEAIKEIEEERRLFYVAMTRTGHTLYVSSNGSPSVFLRECDFEGLPNVSDDVLLDILTDSNKKKYLNWLNTRDTGVEKSVEVESVD